MIRWGRVFLVFVLFICASQTLQSQDRSTSDEWIFVVQSAENTGYDRWWNPLAVRYLKSLIRKYRPAINIGDIILNKEEPNQSHKQSIYKQIGEQLPENSKLKGFVWVGHGSDDGFSIPGAYFHVSGKQMAKILREIPDHIKLSDELLMYFWSCASFSRNQSPQFPDLPELEELNADFEADLIEGLRSFVGGPSNLLFRERRITEVHLIGHQGTAGFADWLPRLPSDWWFRANDLGPDLITTDSIENQIRSFAVRAGLASYLSAVITEINDPRYTPWALAAFPTLTALGTSYIFAKMHYISKQARYIIVDRNGIYRDDDLIARQALRLMLRGQAKCHAKMQLIASFVREQ